MKNKNYFNQLRGITRWFCSLLIIAGGLWTTNARGQACSATWSLITSNTPAVAGSITAAVPSAGSGLSNVVSNNATFGYQAQNWSLSGTLPVPATATQYFQFQLAPTAGASLTITTLALQSRNNEPYPNDDLAVFWSNSPTFATSTQFGAVQSMPAGNVSTNLSATATAAVGQTLYFRIYFYFAYTSAIKFGAKTLVLSGTTASSAPMAYSSSTTVQLNNGVAFTPSSITNQIVQVQVVTSGSTSPFNMTSMVFNTSGSTNAGTDIANAKVYYTGITNTFSTTTQFGSTFLNPNGAFTVSGSQVLSSGTNYFWVTYDIKPSPTIGDLIDACCNSIVMSGVGGTQTPSIPCPAGSASVNLAYCTTGLYSSGCAAFGDYIDNLTLSNINHNTGCTGGTGIANFTGLTCNLLQNTTPAYSITVGEGGDFVGFWIDYNNNGSFGDANEFIGGTTVSGGTTITGNVSISTTAPAGNHRMRVRLVWGTAQSLLTSCTAYTWGETHDYTANITTNTSPSVTNFSPASACTNSGQSIVLTGINYVSPSTVTFNGTAAPGAVVNSPTQITVSLPNGATTGPVAVTNANGTGSSTTNFVVSPLPSAVTVTPASGALCIGAIQSLIASGGTSLPKTPSSGTIAVIIPDATASGSSTSLAISGIPAGATITSMSVNFNISMSFDGDLDLNLTAPNGNTLNLVNEKGGAGVNFTNTTVSSAGVATFASSSAPFTATYAPDAAIGFGATAFPSNVAAFSNLYSVPNGTWTFSGRDVASLDQATITSWSITINYTGPTTWLPIANLWIDAGATTTPYTTNTNASTVYYKPTASGSPVITATTTGDGNCTAANSSSLTVNPSSTPAVSISQTTGTATSCSNTTVGFTATASNLATGTVSTYNFKVDGSTAQNTGSNVWNGTIASGSHAVTCDITVSGGTCLTSSTATSNSIALNLTAPATPTISTVILTGTNPECAGSNITFRSTAASTGGGTSIQYTYRKNGTIVQGPGVSKDLVNPALANGDLITCDLTFTGGCVTSNSASSTGVTMSVSSQPTATAGGSQSICQNGTATVSGATSSNGAILWTHNGGGSLSGANTLTPTYTPVAGDAGNTVTLTLTVSNSPCTAATAFYSVIVKATPTASAGGSQTICSNGTATVSGASSSNGTILWTHNGNGTISNATTLTPTYNAVAADGGNTVTLTLTVSNAPCTPATATYAVNASAAPTASAGGSQSICANGAATVSGATSSNGTILWTHDGNGTISNATTLTPTYNAVAADGGNTVTLTLTVSNAPCTPATATYAVNVSAAPTASAGGSQSICANGAATVSGATSSNGTILWTHDGNGSLTGANTLTPTYNAVAGDGGNTVTLTMTVSNAPCTDATAFYTVNVSAAPTASAGGSSNICGISSATVTGASSSNGTILWTHNGSGTLTNANTNAPTYSAVAGDVGNTVTLTMTVSNPPCADATATYTMNVRALPTAAVSLTGSSSICIGQATQVTINFTGPTASWNWELSDGTNTYSGTGETNPTKVVTVTPPSGGTHTYTVTTTGGNAFNDGSCNGTASGSAVVNVNTGPPANSITFITGGVGSACNNDVVQLNTNNVLGSNIQYTWNQGSNSSAVLFGPTATGPFTTTYTGNNNTAFAKFGALGTGQSGYNVCVFAGNGCPNNTNNKCQFIRGATSTPGFISGQTTVCNNASPVSYTAGTVAGATSYTWSFSGGATFSNNGTSSPSTNVTYTQTNPAGQLCVTSAVTCNGPNSAVQSPAKCVTIGNSIATPDVISGPVAVCPGSATTYTYSVPNDPNASSYQWTLPAGVTGSSTANSIVVQVNSLAGTPNICVNALSSCGTQSASRCKTIISGIPATPGNIAGPLRGVCSGDQLDYSVVNVPGTTYTWTVPSAATGVNPTGNSVHFFITGTPVFGSGSVSVTATNGACAASAPRSIVIYGPPDQPATLTSNPNPVCANLPASFTSAIPVGANPNNFTWSVSGGTITSIPPYTNIINVSWGGGSGSVTASAKNVCGTGGAKILSVVPGCRANEAAAGSVMFAVYPNPAHDQLTLSIDAKESAVYNVRLLDLAGRVLVSENQSASAGLNQYQMDLTHLAKGVYMLTVQSAGDSWKTRIAVE